LVFNYLQAKLQINNEVINNFSQKHMAFKKRKLHLLQAQLSMSNSEVKYY